MRPQVVETHLVPADGFSTLRYSHNHGDAIDAATAAAHSRRLTRLSRLLFAEVSPQALASSLRLSPRAHQKCIVDLGKLQDSRRDDDNYAQLR